MSFDFKGNHEGRAPQTADEFRGLPHLVTGLPVPRLQGLLFLTDNLPTDEVSPGSTRFVRDDENQNQPDEVGDQKVHELEPGRGEEKQIDEAHKPLGHH